MKANEYKAWYRRNDPESARRGLEEYSRPFGERYERPPEYSFGQEAYPQYPERLDISEKQEAYQRGEEDKKQASKSKSSQGDKAKKLRGNSATRGILSAIATPVAGIVVGAVVLVSAYQAIEAENAPELPPIVATVDCDWGEDYSSATITLTDENGTYIATLPATITVAEEPSSCTKEGSKTYTATATYDDKSYSDTRTEVLPTVAHDYRLKSSVDEGDLVVSVFECEHCHAEKTIEVQKTENDN